MPLTPSEEDMIRNLRSQTVALSPDAKARLTDLEAKAKQPAPSPYDKPDWMPEGEYQAVMLSKNMRDSAKWRNDVLGIGPQSPQPGAQSQGGAPAAPWTQVQIGPNTFTAVPNPAYGQATGQEWDGTKWVRIDPNRAFKEQTERRMMEMELKRREEEMAQDRWKRETERKMAEWAWEKQTNPSAQLAPMPSQRPSAALTPGQPDQLSPEERLAHNRQMVEVYQKQAAEQSRAKSSRPQMGMAQPIQPPAQGTPYGQWLGKPPAETRTADWRDEDGNGVDDRYQTGPGTPSNPGASPTPMAADGNRRLFGGLRAKPKPGEQQNYYPKGPNGGALLPDGREVYF